MILFYPSYWNSKVARCAQFSASVGQDSGRELRRFRAFEIRVEEAEDPLVTMCHLVMRREEALAVRCLERFLAGVRGVVELVPQTASLWTLPPVRIPMSVVVARCSLSGKPQHLQYHEEEAAAVPINEAFPTRSMRE